MAENPPNVVAVTMYKAACAGCGIQYDYGDFYAWDSPESAVEMAREDYAWRLQDDGRLLCLDCRHKPGGDAGADS